MYSAHKSEGYFFEAIKGILVSVSRLPEDVEIPMSKKAQLDRIRVGYLGLTSFYKSETRPFDVRTVCPGVDVHDINRGKYPALHEFLHHYNQDEMNQSHTHAVATSGLFNITHLECILTWYRFDGAITLADSNKITTEFARYEQAEKVATQKDNEKIAEHARVADEALMGFGQAFILSFCNYLIDRVIEPFLNEKCPTAVSAGLVMGLHGLTNLLTTGAMQLPFYFLNKALTLGLEKAGFSADHWLHHIQRIILTVAQLCNTSSLLELGSDTAGAALGSCCAAKLHHAFSAITPVKTALTEQTAPEEDARSARKLCA